MIQPKPHILARAAASVGLGDAINVDPNRLPPGEQGFVPYVGQKPLQHAENVFPEAPQYQQPAGPELSPDMQLGMEVVESSQRALEYIRQGDTRREFETVDNFLKQLPSMPEDQGQEFEEWQGPYSRRIGRITDFSKSLSEQAQGYLGYKLQGAQEYERKKAKEFQEARLRQAVRDPTAWNRIQAHLGWWAAEAWRPLKNATMDLLPAVTPFGDMAERAAYDATIQELARIGRQEGVPEDELYQYAIDRLQTGDLPWNLRTAMLGAVAPQIGYAALPFAAAGAATGGAAVPAMAARIGLTGARAARYAKALDAMAKSGRLGQVGKSTLEAFLKANPGITSGWQWGAVPQAMKSFGAAEAVGALGTYEHEGEQVPLSQTPDGSWQFAPLTLDYWEGMPGRLGHGMLSGAIMAGAAPVAQSMASGALRRMGSVGRPLDFSWWQAREARWYGKQANLPMRMLKNAKPIKDPKTGNMVFEIGGQKLELKPFHAEVKKKAAQFIDLPGRIGEGTAFLGMAMPHGGQDGQSLTAVDMAYEFGIGFFGRGALVPFPGAKRLTTKVLGKVPGSPWWSEKQHQKHLIEWLEKTHVENAVQTHELTSQTEAMIQDAPPGLQTDRVPLEIRTKKLKRWFDSMSKLFGAVGNGQTMEQIVTDPQSRRVLLAEISAVRGHLRGRGQVHTNEYKMLLDLERTLQPPVESTGDLKRNHPIDKAQRVQEFLEIEGPRLSNATLQGVNEALTPDEIRARWINERKKAIANYRDKLRKEQGGRGKRKLRQGGEPGTAPKGKSRTQLAKMIREAREERDRRDQEQDWGSASLRGYPFGVPIKSPEAARKKQREWVIDILTGEVDQRTGEGKGGMDTEGIWDPNYRDPSEGTSYRTKTLRTTRQEIFERASKELKRQQAEKKKAEERAERLIKPPEVLREADLIGVVGEGMNPETVDYFDRLLTQYRRIMEFFQSDQMQHAIVGQKENAKALKKALREIREEIEGAEPEPLGYDDFGRRRSDIKDKAGRARRDTGLLSVEGGYRITIQDLLEIPEQHPAFKNSPLLPVIKKHFPFWHEAAPEGWTGGEFVPHWSVIPHELRMSEAGKAAVAEHLTSDRIDRELEALAFAKSEGTYESDREVMVGVAQSSYRHAFFRALSTAGQRIKQAMKKAKEEVEKEEEFDAAEHELRKAVGTGVEYQLTSKEGHNEYYTIRDGGEPIGRLEIVRMPGENPHLELVEIDEASQRQGHGLAAVRWAEQQGVVTASAKSKAGAALLKKAGWEVKLELGDDPAADIWMPRDIDKKSDADKPDYVDPLSEAGVQQALDLVTSSMERSGEERTLGEVQAPKKKPSRKEWREFLELSKRVSEAEKHPSEGTQLDRIAPREGERPEDFSRARGYTEAEIADFNRLMEMHRDFRERGVTEDQLFFAEKKVWDRVAKRRGPEPRVTKVISGGQTGADLGGLVGAKRVGIETGGTAAPGYRTEAGPKEKELRELGLSEFDYGDRELSVSEGYKFRTQRNILDSDGTVIFAKDKNSPGTKFTVNYATQHGKAVIVNPKPKQLREWLIKEGIQVLNVAGNRESKAKGISKGVADVIQRALSPMPGRTVAAPKAPKAPKPKPPPKKKKTGVPRVKPPSAKKVVEAAHKEAMEEVAKALDQYVQHMDRHYESFVDGTERTVAEEVQHERAVERFLETTEQEIKDTLFSAEAKRKLVRETEQQILEELNLTDLENLPDLVASAVGHEYRGRIILSMRENHPDFGAMPEQAQFMVYSVFQNRMAKELLPNAKTLPGDTWTSMARRLVTRRLAKIEEDQGTGRPPRFPRKGEVDAMAQKLRRRFEPYVQKMRDEFIATVDLAKEGVEKRTGESSFDRFVQWTKDNPDKVKWVTGGLAVAGLTDLATGVAGGTLVAGLPLAVIPWGTKFAPGMKAEKAVQDKMARKGTGFIRHMWDTLHEAETQVTIQDLSKRGDIEGMRGILAKAFGLPEMLFGSELTEAAAEAQITAHRMIERDRIMAFDPGERKKSGRRREAWFEGIESHSPMDELLFDALDGFRRHNSGNKATGADHPQWHKHVNERIKEHGLDKATFERAYKHLDKWRNELRREIESLPGGKRWNLDHFGLDDWWHHMFPSLRNEDPKKVWDYLTEPIKRVMPRPKQGTYESLFMSRHSEKSNYLPSAIETFKVSSPAARMAIAMRRFGNGTAKEHIFGKYQTLGWRMKTMADESLGIDISRRPSKKTASDPEFNKKYMEAEQRALAELLAMHSPENTPHHNPDRHRKNMGIYFNAAAVARFRQRAKEQAGKDGPDFWNRRSDEEIARDSEWFLLERYTGGDHVWVVHENFLKYRLDPTGERPGMDRKMALQGRREGWIQQVPWREVAEASIRQGGLLQLANQPHRLAEAEKYVDWLHQPTLKAYSKIFDWMAGWMYHTTIGGADPRAAMHNLIGSQWMNFNELGLRYWGEGAQLALGAAAASKEGGLSGYFGRQTIGKNNWALKILEESGMFHEGTYFSDTMALPHNFKSKAIDKTVDTLRKSSFFFFKKSEDMARAVGYLGAYKRAMDRYEVRTGKKFDANAKLGKQNLNKWAHREALRAVTKTAAWYSATNAPGAFRHPIGRMFLHLNRYSVMYMNEVLRGWRERSVRPERLARAMMSGFILVQIGQMLGQELGFMFGVRTSELGASWLDEELTLGAQIPALNKGDWSPGGAVGDFRWPFPLPHDWAPPIRLGLDLSSIMGGALRGDDTFVNNMGYQLAYRGRHMLDQLIPFYKFARRTLAVGAAAGSEGIPGITDEGVEAFRPLAGVATGEQENWLASLLRVTGAMPVRKVNGYDNPWVKTGFRNRTAYRMSTETIWRQWMAPGMVESIDRQMRDSEMDRAYERRDGMNRQAAFDKVVTALEEGEWDTARSVMMKYNMRPQDVERQWELRNHPAWIRSLSGTTELKIERIYDRYLRGGTPYEEILEALMVHVSDESNVTRENAYQMGQILRQQ